MKRSKHLGFTGGLNNYGFTLIELLISIAILVIIMVPLMNNFFHAMKMNRKAEQLQTESNVAADIMEGLKNLNMEDTLKQFDGTESFKILTDLSGVPNAGEITRLTKDPITGEFEIYKAEHEQATYYFAIHDIKAGGSAYDALITMDPGAYSTRPNTMNDYPMPDLINLDGKANGLLQSTIGAPTDTIDANVLTTFIARGTDYAMNTLYLNSPEYNQYTTDHNYWLAQHDNAINGGLTPLPIPEPTAPPFDASDVRYKQYIDPGTVKSLITKNITITVDNDSAGNGNTIDYQIDYVCNWPVSDIEKTINYQISDTKYAAAIQNIYLFYNTSDFYVDILHPDQVTIKNLTNDKPVNLYIANQSGGAIIDPYITINRSSADDNVSIFTNFKNSHVSVNVGGAYPGGSVDYNLITGEKVNRIFDVTITICPYVNGEPKDKYKKVLYTLKSSREN